MITLRKQQCFWAFYTWREHRSKCHQHEATVLTWLKKKKFLDHKNGKWGGSSYRALRNSIWQITKKEETIIIITIIIIWIYIRLSLFIHSSVLIIGLFKPLFRAAVFSQFLHSFFRNSLKTSELWNLTHLVLVPFASCLDSDYFCSCSLCSWLFFLFFFS